MKPALANARMDVLSTTTSSPSGAGAQNSGRTPLMVAVGLSDLPIVKLLLDRGADPNVRDAANCTAEMMRCSQASVWWKTDLQILTALVEKGLDVNVANSEGKTLLILAAENNLPEAARGLLECTSALKRPLNLLHQDLRRWTALMRAAENGATECVALMLEKIPAAGLRKFVDLTNEFGQSALHLAAQRGHTDIVKLLLQAGCDFVGKDRDGMTPVELAKEAGHREIFTLLDQLTQAALIVEKQASSARPGNAEFSFGGAANSGGGQGHAGASHGQGGGTMAFLGIGRLLPTGKGLTAGTVEATATKSSLTGSSLPKAGGSTDALARSQSPSSQSSQHVVKENVGASPSSPPKVATLNITIPQIGIPLSKILGEHHQQVLKLATLPVDTIDLPVGLVRTLQSIAKSYGGQVGLGDLANKNEKEKEEAMSLGPITGSAIPVVVTVAVSNVLPSRPPLPSVPTTSPNRTQQLPSVTPQQQSSGGSSPGQTHNSSKNAAETTTKSVWQNIDSYAQTLAHSHSQLQAAIMDVQQLEVSAFRSYYDALRPVEESITDLNALKPKMDKLVNQISLQSLSGNNGLSSVVDLFSPIERVQDRLAVFQKSKASLQTTEGLLSSLLTVRNALQTVGDKVGAEVAVLSKLVGRTCCSICRCAFDDKEHQPMALLGKSQKCGGFR
ncbi:hypothetical protein HDU93_005734 [Gonapodya sp. JEL0774]|nr:hypothetical protein HDU93_005734 [Gonapodya sp. JEL0774]